MLLHVSSQVVQVVQEWPHYRRTMNATKKVQYICAVLLIVTSIMMVAYQVFTLQDVANGLLFYVGQAFLLVASIFGLDYYIDRIKALKVG